MIAHRHRRVVLRADWLVGETVTLELDGDCAKAGFGERQNRLAENPRAASPTGNEQDHGRCLRTGFDYAQAYAVPEPTASAALLSLALPALAARRNRAATHRR